MTTIPNILPDMHIRLDEKGLPFICSGGFQDIHLEWIANGIYSHFPDVKDKKIIEIGAGLSTLTYLHMGFKQVTCIAPDFILSKKLEEGCKANNIDISPLRFEIGLSEMILPRIAEETKNGDMYDVAFIDGDHGWPSVFVDFCYTNYALKKGGLMILDDCHTYAVCELKNFLNEDHTFKLLTETGSGKIAIFEKLTDQKLTSGGMRPYLKRKYDEKNNAK